MNLHPNAKPFLDFVTAARIKHGEKYLYEEDSYDGTNKKVTIICSSHGAFSMYGAHHLRGQGCRDCSITAGTARRRPYKYEDFIELMSTIHGPLLFCLRDEYNETHPTVRCEVHGSFSKTTNSIIERRQGCPECYRESLKYSFGNFVQKARLRHGEEYEYLEETYQSFTENLTIICKTHGNFSLLAKSHVHGTGCPDCSLKSKKEKLTLSYNEFKKRSQLIHGERYSYEQISWVKAGSPVTITCSIHGAFSQVATKHLMGQGCPECAKSMSKGEYAIAKFLASQKIDFKREWTHKSLKSSLGGRPRFDFAIFKFRVLIEFDGEQHLKPVRMFGVSEAKALESFRRLQENDKLKNQWAEDNNWELWRFHELTKVQEQLLLALASWYHKNETLTEEE